jgi:hypothetical protein
MSRETWLLYQAICRMLDRQEFLAALEEQRRLERLRKRQFIRGSHEEPRVEPAA